MAFGEWPNAVQAEQILKRIHQSLQFYFQPNGLQNFFCVVWILMEFDVVWDWDYLQERTR